MYSNWCIYLRMVGCTLSVRPFSDPVYIDSYFPEINYFQTFNFHVRYYTMDLCQQHKWMNFCPGAWEPISMNQYIDNTGVIVDNNGLYFWTTPNPSPVSVVFCIVPEFIAVGLHNN